VEQVLPIFILLGIIIVALALMVVGIFANARARQAQQTPVDGMPPGEAASTPLASDSTAESIAESIAVHLQPNGDVVLEIEGRHFRRMDDIGDNRLAARVRAAIAGMQRFAGITPTAQRPAALELADELRIGHAPGDGALVIEMDGRRYRRLSDLPSEESRRQVLAMIGELTAFAQGLDPAQTSQPATPAPDEFLKQLNAAASAPAPLKSYSLLESLRTPTPKPAPMPIGIAGQVEQILQQQLADNPTLRGWSIHIVTAPDSSLQVQVEGQLLHWPDSVPDGPVRDAIQKAIRAWEQTAGL
jgi:hypothetical protein